MFYTHTKKRELDLIKICLFWWVLPQSAFLASADLKTLNYAANRIENTSAVTSDIKLKLEGESFYVLMSVCSQMFSSFMAKKSRCIWTLALPLLSTFAFNVFSFAAVTLLGKFVEVFSGICLDCVWIVNSPAAGRSCWWGALSGSAAGQAENSGTGCCTSIEGKCKSE